MYQIIGADGKEYGPVGIEQMRQWIADGRINAQSRVKVAGSAEWKTAAEFPELGLTSAAGLSGQARHRPIACGPSRGTAEGSGDNELCARVAIADVFRPAGGHSRHYLRPCGAESNAARASAVWWRRVRSGWPDHGYVSLLVTLVIFTRITAAGVEPGQRQGPEDQLRQ